MEKFFIEQIKNLPEWLKGVCVLGMTNAIIKIFRLQSKEIKALTGENFNLKDENEELKSKKICTNCKKSVII